MARLERQVVKALGRAAGRRHEEPEFLRRERRRCRGREVERVGARRGGGERHEACSVDALDHRVVLDVGRVRRIASADQHDASGRQARRRRHADRRLRRREMGNAQLVTVAKAGNRRAQRQDVAGDRRDRRAVVRLGCQALSEDVADPEWVGTGRQRHGDPGDRLSGGGASGERRSGVAAARAPPGRQP